MAAVLRLFFFTSFIHQPENGIMTSVRKGQVNHETKKMTEITTNCVAFPTALTTSVTMPDLVSFFCFAPSYMQSHCMSTKQRQC